MIISYDNETEQLLPKREAASALESKTEQLNDKQGDNYLQPLLASGWSTLDFIESPAELLALFDLIINSGKETLHKWQVEDGELFGKVKPTSKHPFRYALCAANGSGKDAYVIAPFAVWLIVCKIQALVVITSSSNTQLQNQTEKYITQLCHHINAWAVAHMGQEILKVKQKHITCLLSGSEIHLFVTDEEGKAEGYHPKQPGADFAIIVNEGKSVPPEIFRALNRCTGFNYWLNISSPGQPQGDFFRSFINWPHKRRVTIFDCPHLSLDLYEEDRKVLGEHDPYFRSKWLALFTSIDGKGVINQIALERLQFRTKEHDIRTIKTDSPLKIGIDIALSTNGDESVIAARKGNRHFKLRIHRIKDATVLADNLERDLLDLEIPKDHPYIWADDGGVGRAVIDILRRKGWVNIKRVLNQSPPKNKKQFRNRGAEIWYKFAKLVEHNIPILPDDEKLFDQIKSRKYKTSNAGTDRLTLQAKPEMISEGLPSPDRADAVVLSYTDENANELIDLIESTAGEQKQEETFDDGPPMSIHQRAIFDLRKKIMSLGEEKKQNVISGKRFRGLSANIVMKRQSKQRKQNILWPS